MNALARFQAAMPSWRPTVEAWLDTLPATVRTDPARAGLAYLFASPPLHALSAELSNELDDGLVDWPTLEQRATQAGHVERALLHSAHGLAAGDPGPALGLMLLFPDVEAFYWAHAAGTVHEIVCQRLRQHAFVVR